MMSRPLLIFIVGGILVWAVMRLLRTLTDALPGDKPGGKSGKKPEVGRGKIIDAEFEDLDEDE